jgi:hypothetical protein
MATARSGQNPGRTGQPARQNPAPARQGRADAGIDPTNQEGQVPSALVGGFSQHYSTGLAGTDGAHASDGDDVTNMAGQLDEGFSGMHADQTADSGLHGTTGGHPAHGGETVTYTDPFGVQGGVNRNVTTQLQIGGAEDSTKFIDGYSPGPSLPGLENNRPTETGVGGRASVHRQP